MKLLEGSVRSSGGLDQRRSGLRATQPLDAIPLFNAHPSENAEGIGLVETVKQAEAVVVVLAVEYVLPFGSSHQEAQTPPQFARGPSAPGAIR